jgi:hypothetical protein
MNLSNLTRTARNCQIATREKQFSSAFIGCTARDIMDAETVRTITTSAITAVSTLGAAGIVSYFGHRNQKLSADTTKLKEMLQKRNRDLAAAYLHVSAYYQLEQLYSAELAAKSGEAQKTLKSRIRGAVEANGFERPEWTSGECNQWIRDLDS